MSNFTARIEVLDNLFYAATGMLAPGKDCPASFHPPDRDERRAKWDEWMANKAWNAVLDYAVWLQGENQNLTSAMDNLLDEARTVAQDKE